jgi:hypothetical protein
VRRVILAAAVGLTEAFFAVVVMACGHPRPVDQCGLPFILVGSFWFFATLAPPLAHKQRGVNTIGAST